MQKQTRSILDELANIGADRDRSRVVETRANNVIVSAINLMNYIDTGFPVFDHLFKMLIMILLTSLSSRVFYSIINFKFNIIKNNQIFLC